MPKNKSVGIVMVSYGHEKYLRRMLNFFEDHMQDGDKLAIIDNSNNGKLRKIIGDSRAVTFFTELKNPGFATAANCGANGIKKDVDIMLFINPDTIPQAGLLDSIRTGAGKGLAAWMPLIILPGGRINSAGNVVHISGLSWCDGYLDAKSIYEGDVVPISELSGACMAFDVKWWNKLGGLSEEYFLYYEDTDISSRIKLLGGKMALLPQTEIVHDYDYNKGLYKWFYIERNRYIYILLNWPVAIILVLLPQLIVAEVGLWFVAVIQGRFVSKTRATLAIAKRLNEVLRLRKSIQATRKVTCYQYLRTLHAELDSPSFGIVSKNRFINASFRGYQRGALLILKFLNL